MVRQPQSALADERRTPRLQSGVGSVLCPDAKLDLLERETEVEWIHLVQKLTQGFKCLSAILRMLEWKLHFHRVTPAARVGPCLKNGNDKLVHVSQILVEGLYHIHQLSLC